MLKQLGEISVERFLKEYWQQKPLCIRQANPDYQSPIAPEELAGFALEEAVESRIIIEKPANRWNLRHGPFTVKDFDKLPKTHSTLLVQGVDALDADVSQLLDLFRFLPSWRLDDIMVSYATDQGSVGPHFDHYDVFLLQTQGKRLWKVGDMCDATTVLADDCDLSILENFISRDEWLLEPGDMLYLPPRLAHWGIAQGDCMTYSIGFRAPKLNEMLSNFCDYLLSSSDGDEYYRDAALNITTTPGEIDTVILDSIQKKLLDRLGNKDIFATWFGEFASTPRYRDLVIEYDNLEECDDEDCGHEHHHEAQSSNGGMNYHCHDENCGDDHHFDGNSYEKVPGQRYLYTLMNNDVSKNRCLLFINGSHWETDVQFARTICDTSIVNITEVIPENCPLLDELIELGYLQPAMT